MKNICIPTDFSACASHAIDAGMKLAKQLESHVHLITSLSIPKNWNTLSQDEKNNFPEALQKIHNAEVLFNDIINKYSDVKIQTYIIGNKLVEGVKNYVIEHGIDFLVMGSHGSSGKNEYFIGSNTQKVVRAVHCPVLIVKNKLETIQFDKVVFASNFNENEKEAFLQFKDFVKHFIPEIHLVAIHTSSFFDPPYVLSKHAMEDFKELCHPFDCKTHVYRDFTIEKGIRTFSEELGAKLIGISNVHRHPLKRIVAGSNVEALINHSTLPVLSIDFVEVPVEES
ncbi:MAG: universal stress protein [Bacteroidota bacterium]